MPLGFPISGHRHELWGGRPRPRATPRSRISVGKRWISGTKSGTGASRADLGVRPTRTAAPPSFRNYAALGLTACATKASLRNPTAVIGHPSRAGAMEEA
jgi:hypothetical protein